MRNEQMAGLYAGIMKEVGNRDRTLWNGAVKVALNTGKTCGVYAYVENGLRSLINTVNADPGAVKEQINRWTHVHTGAGLEVSVEGVGSICTRATPRGASELIKVVNFYERGY